MHRLSSVLVLSVFLLSGCSSVKKSGSVSSNVRNYNGTASVGDFLTIKVDSAANTISYDNHTNGQSGTVPYSVNSDGSYTITDPQGNLLEAYEIPGYAMVVEAANAGPNQDTSALITAIESVPASINSFAGQNFNMIQFRTRDGGVEIGTVSIDASGNITARSYDPGAIMWSGATYFNGGTMLASGIHEDSSGTFFTVTDQGGGQSTVFGTQNGLWAVDNSNGGILGLPKASSKAFNPSSAGTYSAIYYEKPNAQMMNNVENGTAVEGKATVVVDPAGNLTITDSQNNPVASGTLSAIADTAYIYDGTTNTLPDPCYGLFTFRSDTASLHQDVFVAFQGNAVIFSSFQTPRPLVNNGTYTYFYGVGLK